MFLKESLEKAKQLRLSWKGVIAVIGGTIAFVLLFVRFGRFDLARPTLFSGSMIAFAIAVRWELRRRVWFWITMIVITAIHVPLILFVPWTTKWVPAIVITPVIAVDLYAMLAILSFVEKFAERPKPSES
jgi:hypothetical protein